MHNMQVISCDTWTHRTLICLCKQFVCNFCLELFICFFLLLLLTATTIVVSKIHWLKHFFMRFVIFFTTTTKRRWSYIVQFIIKGKKNSVPKSFLSINCLAYHTLWYYDTILFQTCVYKELWGLLNEDSLLRSPDYTHRTVMT